MQTVPCWRYEICGDLGNRHTQKRGGGQESRIDGGGTASRREQRAAGSREEECFCFVNDAANTVFPCDGSPD